LADGRQAAVVDIDDDDPPGVRALLGARRKLS
jgi:hypothetical protein